MTTSASLIENLEEQFENDVQFQRRPLPPIVRAEDLITSLPPMPTELVKGVLHQGSKMVLGGASKSFKTWTLLDLALSVQAGLPWWGFETVKTKVLYINFEIQDAFIARRIKTICEAKQISDSSNLDVWNLRGHSAPLEDLMPDLLSPIRKSEYGLITLDPLYKTLGGRNESDAGDIGEFLNEVERIAVETSAAVVFGAHFAKGNASQKDSIDRISGSGVFARDPDSILTLTKHEVDGAFTVDMTLRNLQPQEPFCVRWEYPVMVKDEELDPKLLKTLKGRPKKYDSSQLLEVLGTKQLTTDEWKTEMQEYNGMTRSAFYQLRKELIEEKAVRKAANDKWERCG